MTPNRHRMPSCATHPHYTKRVGDIEMDDNENTKRLKVEAKVNFSTSSPDSVLVPVHSHANISNCSKRLDPRNNPDHARRVRKRLRMIQYGKNTAGYVAYVTKIPKKNRPRKKTMECPVTPDVYADIPTRRFQGQIKAWRKALHRFDPKDLMPDPGMNHENEQTKALAKELKFKCGTECTDNCGGMQVKQMKEAVGKGLQVTLGEVDDNTMIKSDLESADKRRFDDLFALPNSGRHCNNELSIEMDSDDDLL